MVIPSTNQKSIIEDLVVKLVNDPENDDYKAKLNSKVFDLYGLNKDEALYILDHHKEINVAKLSGKYIS